ncbi:ATPase [Xenococcus sp. PCC 7305]|uniref:NB-ARC domain-containing protein n=1 Tax=Xenococcus sp. PCC 7305 TaxID=102125 RepID=UPI0002ABAC72|nr:NB-ARC domain-containing protein [Xenococcus sp. PCC 7305]ELS04795.1 ATPase [Xenococcus sp. PCC 7305]
MIEQALVLVDNIVFTKTGKHLNDLQVYILDRVWRGQKYLAIADGYGCTEGHAKDVGSLLWHMTSEALQEKVNKSNFRTVIQRHLELNIPTPQENLNINFVGRNNAIADLESLVNRGHNIIVIQGKGGVGKTTLAQQYLATGNFKLVLEFLMAKEAQNIMSVEALVEEWLKRDLKEEPGKEFGLSLARLKRYLKQHKVGILIDNLEPALDKQGQFMASHRNYLELLRVLADQQLKAVTIITSRDRLCEGDLNLKHYRLSGLSFSAWTDFFRLNQLPDSLPDLKKIHFTYGGNAKAMGIIAGVVKEDFAGEIAAYWQENKNSPLVETDLKNLVNNQFARIKELDADAYLLLCRLGCYRYQDVPKISSLGLLALLWDVDNNNNKRAVIESLRNRSLIEFSQGQYWLHPVIKAEALSRLQPKDQENSAKPEKWQEIHQHIAQYYTKTIVRINNIQDGLTALEAYYHYFTIQDYDSAATVILYSRDNQWGQYLTLGSTLYRLGLLQPLLTAIKNIIDQVASQKYRSELNNILGDVSWITGKIYEAITYQQETITTAANWLHNIDFATENQQEVYYWKMLQVDSLLSIGLYHIDLWELEKSANILQQVIDMAQETKHHAWAEKATICLALVKSYLEPDPEIYQNIGSFVEAIINNESNQYNTGRFAYFMQILGQTLINLGRAESAHKLLSSAIAFAQEIDYVQVRAKSLTGLAIIYRQNYDFTSAQTGHQEAIKLLENIGAKCDLAEAYLQFAITLRQANNSEQSVIFFQQARDLFQQLEAPKQLERIGLLDVSSTNFPFD